MTLALAGVSHLDVGLAELEQVSAMALDLPSELLMQHVADGAVLLSTCNRVELYLDSDDSERAVARAGELLDSPTYGIAGLRSRIRNRTGDDVARHLFAVTSGLESMVVGEAEISGQVRAAIADARREGTVTASLDRLFGTASRVSRQVASTTGLGAAGRSVVSVALDLVERDHGPIAGRTVCLIGTGSFARISHTALRARGVGELLLFSLSGRAARFAESHQGTVVGQNGLAAALAGADMVVSCSGAPHPVVDRSALAQALAGGLRTRPLPIVDLALTHDVDEEVRGLAGVHVIDLTDVAEHAPPVHSDAVRRAHRVVEEAVGGFVRVEAGRLADPAIVALREHVRVAMSDELERAERRHAAHTLVAVTGALDRFANGLLHVPSVRIRELVAQGRGAEAMAALELLFGVGPDIVAGLGDGTETHPADAMHGEQDVGRAT
jgi:glutamyl-tRNA reductase